MADRMWYYMKDNEQIGPVGQDELLRLLATGALHAEVYVWADGMAEWKPASEVVDLGGRPPSEQVDQTAGSPAVGADGEPMPASVVRPTSVTVFGILNIVFGCMGLLCTPLAVAVMFLPQQSEALQLGPAMMAYTFVGYVVGFFCTILLLATGIGLLNLKRWARQWSYGYGWFALIWGLIGLLVNIILYAGMLQGADPQTMPAAIGGLVGGACGGIVGLIYPIFLIVYMKRPNVIEACQR